MSDKEDSAIRKRKNQVKVYLSDAELTIFQNIQKETSLSAASIIRSWIAGKQVKSTIDIQAVNEMRRQGGLFKHFALCLFEHRVLSA